MNLADYEGNTDLPKEDGQKARQLLPHEQHPPSRHHTTDAEHQRQLVQHVNHLSIPKSMAPRNHHALPSPQIYQPQSVPYNQQHSSHYSSHYTYDMPHAGHADTGGISPSIGQRSSSASTALMMEQQGASLPSPSSSSSAASRANPLAPPGSLPQRLASHHNPRGRPPHPIILERKPRVTTTLWEDQGTLCFQVEARGVVVARREDNDMINGTKLLNVAGMSRGKRDGILKSENFRSVVKVGTMHLKGVWIPFERALDFATKERITEVLYPLFVSDIKSFLYHPDNYERTAAVLAAASQRQALLQQNSINQQPQVAAVLSSNQPGSFLTPPSSASSSQRVNGEPNTHDNLTRHQQAKVAPSAPVQYSAPVNNSTNNQNDQTASVRVYSLPGTPSASPSAMKPLHVQFPYSEPSKRAPVFQISPTQSSTLDSRLDSRPQNVALAEQQQAGRFAETDQDSDDEEQNTPPHYNSGYQPQTMQFESRSAPPTLNRRDPNNTPGTPISSKTVAQQFAETPSVVAMVRRIDTPRTPTRKRSSISGGGSSASSTPKSGNNWIPQSHQSQADQFSTPKSHSRSTMPPNSRANATSLLGSEETPPCRSLYQLVGNARNAGEVLQYTYPNVLGSPHEMSMLAQQQQQQQQQQQLANSAQSTPTSERKHMLTYSPSDDGLLQGYDGMLLKRRRAMRQQSKGSISLEEAIRQAAPPSA